MPESLMAKFGRLLVKENWYCFGECLNSVHDITLDSDSNVGEELGDSDGMIANVGRQELASTEAAATDNAVADDECNGTQ